MGPSLGPKRSDWFKASKKKQQQTTTTNFFLFFILFPFKQNKNRTETKNSNEKKIINIQSFRAIVWYILT